MNSLKNKKIIYSALVGNYDEIPKHIALSDEWEYILFTDYETNEKEINGWKIYPLQNIIKDDPVKTCRWHKMNPHLLFKDCLCSIWLDCNIIIKDTYIYTRANELLIEKKYIALITHPFRDCAYDEANTCLNEGKDLASLINQNIAFLTKKEFPKNNGLYESNLVFRNHTSNKLIEFDELWWSLVFKMSRRDQLSLTYVLWKLEIKPELFLKSSSYSVRNHHGFNFIEKHAINNNRYEINYEDYLLLQKKVLVEQRLKKIKRSISYKVFYKIESSIYLLFSFFRK
ncbi:MAG: DUF616 domain-containing protein [Flavobacteriaceae bacterium]|nr:DUF616 domain-containing protein [Flavobacteriaceae bacterium]